MIVQFDDLKVAPESYADYRPIFETKRLNVTHVRVWPGQSVPAHTHDDEDQVYYVATGEGVVQLDSEPGRSARRKQRPHPPWNRAHDHQHRE